jgi:TonB family protein
MPSSRVPLRRAGGIGAALALHALAIGLLIEIGRDGLGEKDGTPQGINVEMIDAAALEALFSSVDRGQHHVDMLQQALPPATPPSQPLREEVASEPVAPALAPPVAAPPVLSTPAPSDADADVAALRADLNLMSVLPKAAAGAQKRSAQSTALAADTQAREQEFLQSISKASLAHFGAVDEFTKMVARVLARHKPVSHGLRGRLVVSFVISEAGELRELKLVHSSGLADLDTLVLASLEKAGFARPPPKTPLRDRTFEITYRYR